MSKAQQWDTENAEIRDPPAENPNSKILPFKPSVGPYIVMHATPTAKNFFLANFYLPVHSPAPSPQTTTTTTT